MKIQWIAIIVFFLSACTNNADNTKKETAKSSEHSGHTMSMTEVKGYADSVNDGLIAEDTLKGSPARTSMHTVHGTHVHIEYSSPGVKGRIIWGGLVQYGQVWVTGAHHATRVTFYKDVWISDKKVTKGTYAIFTIPGASEWTIILNKNYEQHLADDYNEKEDVVRIKVKPEEHPFTARLTYAVEELADYEGIINMLWEKVSITLPFKTI